MSADGTIVAIGATTNDSNGSNSGHVRIYQFVNLSTSDQLQSAGINANANEVAALGAAIDDANNTTGVTMMAAIAAAALTTGTAEERLANFKVLMRQAVDKLAAGATDTMDFDRSALDIMVPDIATTLPTGITTIKVIKPDAKRILTVAEISAEAILLMHDATGTSSSDVELNVGGSPITWRVTKDADNSTYTVATSTDGGTTFTTVQDGGGADRTFDAGNSFTAAGDWQASFIFNDTIVNVDQAAVAPPAIPSCGPSSCVR